MKAKRYSMCIHDSVVDDSPIIQAYEDDDGDYVSSSDCTDIEARCSKLEAAGDNLQSVVLELRGMLETQDPERLYQAFEPHYGTLAEFINDWIAAR